MVIRNFILIFVFIVSNATVLPQDYEVAKVTFPNGSTFVCEIADTPLKHGLGLSRHESLEPDKGMLFVYPREKWLSFWMPPEMKFNIDIIFLDKDRRIIHIAHDAPPCPDPTGNDCPSYAPKSRKGKYVVEVVTGKAKENGLKIGDILNFTFPKDFELPGKS